LFQRALKTAGSRVLDPRLRAETSAIDKGSWYLCHWGTLERVTWGCFWQPTATAHCCQMRAVKIQHLKNFFSFLFFSFLFFSFLSFFFLSKLFLLDIFFSFLFLLDIFFIYILNAVPFPAAL
jgi:hypothetical protein